MSKHFQASIVVLILLAVLTASGCLGCSGVSGNNSNDTAGARTATPVPVEPKTVGDLYDMAYLWNNVNYCRLAYDVPDNHDASGGESGTYVLEFHDKAYNGTPAREMIFNTTTNQGGLNMSMDVFFKKSADSSNMTFLGGRALITNVFTDDGPTMIEMPITLEMVEAEASGDFNSMNRQAADMGLDHYDENEMPGTDPDVDRTHKSLDLNTFVQLESSVLEYMPLTYVRTETLTLGGKSYVCKVYNGTYNETMAREALLKDQQLEYELANMEGEDVFASADFSEDRAASDLEDMTITLWYSPEFPAMPVKYIYIVKGNAPYTFTVEDFR